MSARDPVIASLAVGREAPQTVRSKRWLLAIATAVVGLLLVECGMWAWRGAPSAGSHHRVFCSYDKELGWVLTPGTRARRRTDEYEHIESINSLGMRDRERSVAKPAGTRRVLVLGDSFAEGYSVADEETFSRQLEALLRARGESTEVINGGVGGYSTDQELLWFRRVGVSLQPDVVVLAFYGNDILSNARARGTCSRGPKPLFRVVNSQLVEPPIPPAAAPTRLYPVGWHRWTSKLSNVSHAYRYVRGHYWVLKRRFRTRTTQTPRASMNDLQLARESPEVRAAWLATELLVAALAAEARSAGARFVLLWVPQSDLVQPERGQLSSAERVGKRLAVIAAKNGTKLLDPLAALRVEQARLAPGGERIYYARDRHWTRHGHRIVARLLDARLRPP